SGEGTSACEDPAAPGPGRERPPDPVKRLAPGSPAPPDWRPSMPQPLEVLRQVFRYQDFRPGQAQVVEAQLAGRDVLSVAPTGSGKSISYWVPAVTGGSLTLVVSPLIALMKDQVDRLTELDVPATFINSAIDWPQEVDRLRGAIAGDYRALFL